MARFFLSADVVGEAKGTAVTSAAAAPNVKLIKKLKKNTAKHRKVKTNIVRQRIAAG